LMARMAPKHSVADVTHRTAMTSEEIVAELRERGLPVDILPSLAAQPLAISVSYSV
jgi:hypothetical protein